MNAPYDATGTVDPSELQAWLDGQTQAMDERYPGVIDRLLLVLAELSPGRDPGRCRTIRRQVAVWRLR